MSEMTAWKDVTKRRRVLEKGNKTTATIMATTITMSTKTFAISFFLAHPVVIVYGTLCVYFMLCTTWRLESNNLCSCWPYWEQYSMRIEFFGNWQQPRRGWIDSFETPLAYGGYATLVSMFPWYHSNCKRSNSNCRMSRKCGGQFLKRVQYWIQIN